MVIFLKTILAYELHFSPAFSLLRPKVLQTQIPTLLKNACIGLERLPLRGKNISEVVLNM